MLLDSPEGTASPRAGNVGQFIVMGRNATTSP